MTTPFASPSDPQAFHQPMTYSELKTGYLTDPACPRLLHGHGPAPMPTRLERVSINQLTTLRMSFDTDLIEYARRHVPGIGVSWRKLREFGVQRGIRLLQESDLKVSSLGWVGGFTGQHGATLKETLHEARRAIRVAAQIKSPTLIVVTGPLAGHITPHAKRLVIGSLQELAHFADRYDVTLAVKPMAPIYRRDWTFIQDLRMANEIIQAVDRRRVRLALGTFHLWQERELLDFIRQSATLIAHVQLADWNVPRDENDQRLPGDGCIPFDELLGALDDAGYRGWLELEVWSRDLWKLSTPDLIDRCLNSLSKVLGSPGEKV